MKRKTLVTALMAVLLVVCGLGLAACGGPSVEQLIRQDLEEGFSQMKSGDGDFAKGFEESIQGELGEYGVDSSEFTAAYLDGSDYKIGDITVDENAGTATADVSVTIKQMSDLLAAFLPRAMQASLTTSATTEDEFNAELAAIMVEETKNIEPATTDITITYTRDSDGTWSVDEDALAKSMEEATTGDISKYTELAQSLSE